MTVYGCDADPRANLVVCLAVHDDPMGSRAAGGREQGVETAERIVSRWQGGDRGENGADGVVQ